MALDGMDYTLLSLIGLLALLFPLFVKGRSGRAERAAPLDGDDPITRLEVLRDRDGRLLAEFIVMDPMGSIEELRDFQSRWLNESRLCGETMGFALRKEDRSYWEVMVFRQSEGPRLAVHFSITPELYLTLTPPAGRVAN